MDNEGGQEDEAIDPDVVSELRLLSRRVLAVGFQINIHERFRWICAANLHTEVKERSLTSLSA